MGLSRKHDRVDQTLNLFSIILMMMGFLVILGWSLQIQEIVQIFPNSVPMQFNTAFCFFLSGLILHLYEKNVIILSNMLVWVVLILSIMTLAEYYNSINLGIDTLLMHPFTISAIKHPGRMPPNSALAFIFFAIFIYLIQFKSKKILFFSSLFPCVYGVLGVISVLGYILGYEFAYAWDAGSPMAPHAGLAFIILAVTSFLLVSKSKKKMPTKHNAFLTEYLVFAFIFIFFIVLWQLVKINQVKELQSALEKSMDVIISKIQVQIKNELQAIDQLYLRIDSGLYTSTNTIRKDFSSYLKQINGLEMIVSKKASKEIRIITHEPSNETHFKKLQNRCHFSDSINPDQSKDAGLSIAEMGNYLCISNHSFAALINTKKIINDFVSEYRKDFNFIIKNAHGTIVFQTGYETQQFIKKWGQSRPFDIQSLTWQMEIYPKTKFIQAIIGHVPVIIFILGLIIAFLSLYGLRYRRHALLKEKSLTTQRVIKSTILNSTMEGLIGINENFEVLFMNKSAQNILDYAFDESKVIHLKKIIANDNIENKVIINIIQSIRKNQYFSDDDGVFFNADGAPIAVHYSCSPIIDEGKTTGAIIVFFNNHERKKYEKELQYKANYDALTGLPNRQAIISQIDAHISRAQRHHTAFSVCYIDINEFKSINDNYGHYVGDLALKHVGNTINACIRKNDLLGRLSGDEFCLILDGLHSTEAVDDVIEKIRNAFKYPFVHGNIKFKIHLSIGYAIHTSEKNADELLIKADQMMYQEKNQAYKS